LSKWRLQCIVLISAEELYVIHLFGFDVRLVKMISRASIDIRKLRMVDNMFCHQISTADSLGETETVPAIFSVSPCESVS